MKKIEYEKLTIYEVEAFHRDLTLWCEEVEAPLILDLGNVEKIDMVAIQLLLSAQKTCNKKSLDLILKNVSSEIVKTLGIAGCETLLKVQND